MKETWDVLARQYLVQRDGELLTQAIAAATDLDIRAVLHVFEQEEFEEIGRRAQALFQALMAEGRRAEALTIGLLALDVHARLTACYNQFPPEHQSQALQIGIDACAEAISLADSLNDASCIAFFTAVRASGLSSARELKAARTTYEEALEIWRRLAQAQPGVYLPYVAQTLNNLGNVLCNILEMEAARQTFEETLAIYRRLAEVQPDVYLPSVAQTLNNLGSALLSLQQIEASRKEYEEALTIYRQLAQTQPDVYLPDMTTALNHLGNVLRNLREFAAARQTFEEALEIRRRLAQAQPDVYLPYVAQTLNNLGSALRSLQQIEASRKEYEEALTIYRQLAQTQPDVYLPDVAGSLNNIGALLGSTREWDAARNAIMEALTIYRRLAQSQSNFYLPDVAMALNNVGNILNNLREMETARKAFEEALATYRHLNKIQPSVHLPDVALTLNNLGLLLNNIREPKAAHEAFEEALEIRRRLAQAQPDVYLPSVAQTLNNLGSALRSLQQIEASRKEYEEALTIYRQLAQTQPDVYLPDVAGSLNNLGLALSDLPELERAHTVFKAAIDLQESNGLWLESAETHYNMARLERKAGQIATDRIRGHYRACVRRCEQGMRQLQETQHRDKFKGRIEYAYNWLIEDAARRVQEDQSEPRDELIGLLEAVRQVDALAELGVMADGESGAARAETLDQEIAHLLDEHDATLLWVQATPEAVVFAMQTSEARLRVSLAEPALLERMRSLDVVMRRAIEIRAEMRRAPAHEVDTMNVLTVPVEVEAQQVYNALPDMVKVFLTERPERAVFVVPCSVTVNLPWELIQTPTEDGWEYLGLQRHLPRLHSARHLAQMLQRQPHRRSVPRPASRLGLRRRAVLQHSQSQLSTASPTAIVVGDPTRDLEESYFAAEELQAFLKKACGFELVPNNTALIREKATKEALEASLEREFLLWVQLSHGGGDETHLYLAMANGGKIYPHSIAQRHWPQHPIVHQACCYTGLTAAEGGGRFSGHPTAALLAGASCVLSSTMPLFDKEDAEFCARLYHRALNPAEPQTFGEALLATRQEMAAEYGGNPLVWGQYALWGNPWARLVA